MILQSLQWKYQARDFDSLLNVINVFPLLSAKDAQDPQALLAQSWTKVHSKNESLRMDLLATFSDIFISIFSRITDPNYESQIKSKNQEELSSEMALKRKKSMLDEDVSSLLVDSAIRAIFKCFDSIATQKRTLDQFNESTNFSDDFHKLKDFAEQVQFVQSVVDFSPQIPIKTASQLHGDDGPFIADLDVNVSVRQPRARRHKKVPKYVVEKPKSVKEDAKKKMQSLFVE